MTRALVSLALSLVLLVGITSAQYPVCAAPRQVFVQPHHQPVQQTYVPQVQESPQHHRRRLVQVELIQVAAISPAYTSAYSPDGYDSATQAGILTELRRLGIANDVQMKILQVLAQRPVYVPVAVVPGSPIMPPASEPKVDGKVEAVKPPSALLPLEPKVPGPPAGGLAVMNAKCAACHQAGKLAADQRFTLLDMKGELAPLTAAQKLKVLLKTYSAQMPPPNNIHGITPLTDADFAKIVDAVQGG